MKVPLFSNMPSENMDDMFIRFFHRLISNANKLIEKDGLLPDDLKTPILETMELARSKRIIYSSSSIDVSETSDADEFLEQFMNAGVALVIGQFKSEKEIFVPMVAGLMTTGNCAKISEEALHLLRTKSGERIISPDELVDAIANGELAMDEVPFDVILKTVVITAMDVRGKVLSAARTYDKDNDVFGPWESNYKLVQREGKVGAVREPLDFFFAGVSAAILAVNHKEPLDEIVVKLGNSEYSVGSEDVVVNGDDIVVKSSVIRRSSRRN